MEYICCVYSDSTPKMQVIKRNLKDNARALYIGFSNAYGRISNNMTG